MTNSIGTRRSSRSPMPHIASMSAVFVTATGSWIAAGALNLIGQRIRRTRERAVSELVEAGLWVTEGTGFRIKNYLKFQPSKAQIEDRRTRMEVLGRAGGIASGLKRGASSVPVEPSR